jgi:Flp pilus assembly protein TadD
VQAFREAIRLRPDFANAHYNLGFVLDQKGQSREAAEAFKEAARINPRDGDAFYMLGLSRAKLEQYDDALAAMQQCVKLKPNDAEARYRLGALYLMKGDKPAAERERDALKPLDQKLSEALSQLISQQ